MKIRKLCSDIFTLSPSDAKKKKDFEEFRNTDVGEMLHYVIAYSMISFLVLGAVCYHDSTLPNFVNLAT